MMQHMFCLMIFIPMIIMSSILIFITDSWMGQWMIMEINMISFLALVIFEKKNSVVAMNYFFIQSFMSYYFFMLVMNSSMMNSFMVNLSTFAMNLCMLSKMGLPPFYMWYIKMMKSMNWINCFLLMTFQKIIPMFVMNNLSFIYNFLVIKFNMINMVFMSLICAIMGLQSLNLKILLAYSSIIQMGWMIMMMYISEKMFLNMMLIYFMISLSLILVLKKFNCIYLFDLSLMFMNSKFMYMHYMWSLFSLSGIPPFFGFMLKWISIQEISNFYTFFMITLMIINSLISMYFYIRMMFICLVGSMYSIKLNQLIIYNGGLFKFDFKFIYLIWIMLSGLMIYEII